MADAPPKSDMEKGTDVAAAGVAAASQETTPEAAQTAASQAIRTEAQKVQVEISDDDANKIAAALVEQMRAAGAFDPPPAPEPAAAPAAEPAAATQENHAPPEPPRPRSFAERFRG